jgi:hypothetical protein
LPLQSSEGASAYLLGRIIDMAKFKCITSNEVYEFALEHDIAAMRKHPEYVEVVETEDKPARKAKKETKDEEADE